MPSFSDRRLCRASWDILSARRLNNGRTVEWPAESTVAEVVQRALVIMGEQPTTENPSEAWERICRSHPEAREADIWFRQTAQPVPCPSLESVYEAAGVEA